MPDKILKEHIATITNKNQMTVTGVNNIKAYDENTIVLVTDYGQMIIQGRNLLTGEINSSQGLLKLTGDIEVIHYKQNKIKTDGILGLLKK